MRFSVLLFFVTVFVGLSFPQQGEYIYKNLTPDDGLPSNETYDLMQSEDGYMYIATDQGLARFDGEEFKVYNEKDGIKGSAVFNVYPDPSGRIWMRTLGNAYFLSNGSVSVFEPGVFLFEKDSFPLLNFTVFFDSVGNPKYLADSENNYLFIKDSVEFVQIGKENLNNQRVSFPRFFKVLPNKNLVQFSSYSNYIPNKNTLKDTAGYFRFLNADINYSNSNFTKLKFYSINDSIVLGASEVSKGFLININSKQFDEITVPKSLFGIKVLGGDEIIVLTRNGSYNTTSSFRDFAKMSEHFTTSIEKDHEHNLWMTDHNNGVRLIPNRFIKVFYSDFKPVVTGIHLWKMGKNLNVIFSDGRVFDIQKKKYLKENLYGKMSKTNTKSLFYSRGKFFLAASEIKFEGFNANNKEIQERTIVLFRKARIYGDTILLATNSGPSILINSSFENSFFADTINNQVRLHNMRLYMNYTHRYKHVVRTEDVLKADHNIWAATVDGLLLYTEDSIESYSNLHPILSSRLTALDDFHPNYLAIGSRSSGVFLMHKMKHNLLFPISHSDKIKSSAIRSLYSSNDTLYATSNKGLFMFKLSNDTFYQIAHFDSKNGLPTNDISDIEEHDGKIWIATKKGLVFFQKGSLKPDDYYTPIHLTHFSFDDHQRRIDSTFIQFQKDQRDLTFWYKGISFKSAGDLKYKLILSGPSKDSLVTQNTETRFTNLEPGTYTLKIWAQNNTGNWSLKPATLTFSIPEKFHESIWFYILCFLAFGLFTAFLTFLYQQQKKKLLERKLSTNELEQRALAAQMNPHFIHNTLAAIQQLFNAGDMEECNNYIAMFSKLVRLNLNSIREGYISVETEIKRLQLYLDIEKTRFGNRLSYSIEVDPKVDTSYMEIPAMLLQPFVENALWHGLLPKPEGGEIHIKFGSKEKHLIIEILDNGVGYNPSAEKKRDKEDPSVAMEITKNRLNLLSKKSGQTNDFTIQNRKDITGTQVIVTLYIGED
jgi:anti-sigma regulatory factor (Ser/Thr protein kinase)